MRILSVWTRPPFFLSRCSLAMALLWSELGKKGGSYMVREVCLAFIGLWNQFPALKKMGKKSQSWLLSYNNNWHPWNTLRFKNPCKALFYLYCLASYQWGKVIMNRCWKCCKGPVVQDSDARKWGNHTESPVFWNWLFQLIYPGLYRVHSKSKRPITTKYRKF